MNPEHLITEDGNNHVCYGAECPVCSMLPVGRVTFGGEVKNVTVSRKVLTPYEIRERYHDEAWKQQLTKTSTAPLAQLTTFRDSLGHIPASYPKAILPSITAIISDASRTDEHIWLLCHQRRDNVHWGFPGGAQNVGESILETVHREVKEETGLDVRIDGLVCVDSNPTHGALCSYPDGVVHYTNLSFACTWIGGELRLSEESLRLAWYTPLALPQPFLETHAWRLEGWQAMWGCKEVAVR